MLSKFYSVLIGIVIALTLVGLVLAGVTRMRGVDQAAVSAVSEAENAMPVPNTTTPDVVVSSDTPVLPNTVASEPRAPSPAAAEEKAPAPKPRAITVLAKNFKFEPSQITVKKGETVTITVKSTEGVHNLLIAGYNIRSEVKSMGESASVTFVADKTGTFDMWCEVGSHKALGMTGKLIVE